MISNAAKLAIKTLSLLVHQPNRTIRAQELSKELDVQKPYLSKILQQLATKGFVSSVKGPKGGFYITEEQKERSVMDVIIEIEGKDRFSQCLLNFDSCDQLKPCAIHHLVFKEKEALRRQFGTISIAALE